MRPRGAASTSPIPMCTGLCRIPVPAAPAEPPPAFQVLPKRTNMPGISTTDRGGYRGRFQARGGLAQRGGYYGGLHPRVRGRTYR